MTSQFPRNEHDSVRVSFEAERAFNLDHVTQVLNEFLEKHEKDV